MSKKGEEQLKKLIERQKFVAMLQSSGMDSKDLNDFLGESSKDFILKPFKTKKK